MNYLDKVFGLGRRSPREGFHRTRRRTASKTYDPLRIQPPSILLVELPTIKIHEVVELFNILYVFIASLFVKQFPSLYFIWRDSPKSAIFATYPLVSRMLRAAKSP